MDGLDQPDYVIAGIAVFRYIEPRFVRVPDSKIIQLYGQWSNEQAAASWLGVTNRGAENFCKWAFTTPVEFVMSQNDGGGAWMG